MYLSVVTTLYQSADHLKEFHQRMSAAARSVTDDYELIFVDDGSTDESLQIALSLHESDSRVKVAELSRNFGHHKAQMTGLDISTGELVLLIDCDLEEDPRLLAAFHDKLGESDADVVFGVQDKRKGKLSERLFGALFYKLFNFLSSHPIPENIVTLRLMRRPYVDALLRHRDKELFMGGIWTITGFRQTPFVIHKTSRGKSTYSLTRKMSIVVNSITSFSSKPLYYLFYLGLTFSTVGLVLALYVVIVKLWAWDYYLAGWASLIVSIWLVGGLNLIGLGLVGIYVSKVFMESKDRPLTIVRRLYQQGEESDNGIGSH